jgi:superfamily II DNA or RNA helicase
MQKELFEHDYSRQWPPQHKFPINEETQGSHVSEVLKKDIQNTENLLIITGFTSLSNLVEIFGTTDYPLLKNTKIVIGFDVDERVNKKLVHYSLQPEVKEYWIKQGVSIRLCGAKINIIEKIKRKEIDFRSKKRLHAKLYVGDEYAMLGSSNFSKSGLVYQREANIRVAKDNDPTEQSQYEAIRQLAENYYELSDDYNDGIIDLLNSLLKDATWEEALARAIAEIQENKWMKDFPVLYKAIVNTELWPSQRMGIARAMSVIQDQGNVLLADPTGSGKTKLATTLAYTLFHWLGENGHKDRSNALVIAPKQVVENWEAEDSRFTLSNKIESMGKLSNSKGKSIDKLQKEIEKVDILLIDEAHNYLNWKSIRSSRIRPKHSSHIILSTATPINKKADDLLRLIELLDIDNLSDEDLANYIELRKKKISLIDDTQLTNLRNYINQFIVRRTKKELNKMIERDPEAYKNSNGHRCKYPKAIADTYTTGETERDKEIAKEVHELLSALKGINYLQKLNIPPYFNTDDDKKQYLTQRFNSAPALAGFEIKSTLRSSHVALFEYLYGSDAANHHFKIKSPKSKSGNVIGTLHRCKEHLPKTYFPDDWISAECQWILKEESFKEACENEIRIYEKIGELCLQFSGKRESAKAKKLLDLVNQFGKILAFDSTVITLDYLHHLIEAEKRGVEVIVATGQNEKNKRLVREKFANANSDTKTKVIALCSDAMAEGINLPSAKALMLLDMPSVMRIIEQRIGRLERMDSEHKEVHIFWPDDSEEFSLNGDRRVFETLLVTTSLIRSNVDMPIQLFNKYLKNGLNVQNIIKAYQEYSEEETEWQGVKDSTQNIYSLIEGKAALIDRITYDLYKDVESTVKCAISFVESDKVWSFFCFKGTATRSPKWLLIDERNKVFTDFSEITDKLKLYLNKKKIVQRKWREVDTNNEITNIIRKLRMKEKELLPNKKKRALAVAEKILNSHIDKETGKSIVRKELLYNIAKLFKAESDDKSVIDFDRFAEIWLSILQPVLDLKRKNQIRKRKIITLKDITYKDVKLNSKVLASIYESCQAATALDEMISACIIAIKPNHL